MQEQKSTIDESKNFLFSKISHELKSPIHGISGLANFLDENWNILDDKSRKQYTHDISLASIVLNEMMESLLGFFRLDLKAINFDFIPCDLIAEANIAIERCKIFLSPEKKHLNIELQSEFSEAEAVVDKFWFRQLLHNLLSNSINHSSEGNITLAISKIHDEHGAHFIICIKDEGVGIQESELETIFQAFHQGSKSHLKVGFGLGLAICQEVVSAHNGKIWAQNNRNKGASIFFSIPINHK